MKRIWDRKTIIFKIEGCLTLIENEQERGEIEATGRGNKISRSMLLRKQNEIGSVDQMKGLA